MLEELAISVAEERYDGWIFWFATDRAQQSDEFHDKDSGSSGLIR